MLYRARTALRAASRAKKDIAAYLAANPEFSQVSQSEIFILNERVANLDGAEVWSCLHKGPANAARFWRDRYKKYAL